MVILKLLRETRDGSVVVEIESPVISGAWQVNGDTAAFHDELVREYPHLNFAYCYRGRWEIQYAPSDDSMIEMAELVARISQEEIAYHLNVLQYISNHPIPNLAAPGSGSEQPQ
jgi:hypothetical protein